MVSTASGAEWDYAAVDRVVEKTAGRLASLEVAPGDHLGVCLAPRPQYAVVVHAAMRRGAVLVPLGHRNTATELATRAGRADVTALVCDSETAPAVTDAAAEFGSRGLPVVSVDETAEDLPTIGDVDPAPAATHDWSRTDTLALLSTSGTTGTPKIVSLTVGNVLASAVASAFRLGVVPGDRWLATLPMHHTGGLMPVYRCALYGTTLVVREGFDPGPAVDDVRSFEVTGVSLVPTMLRRMLDARGTLPDSLRVVLLGGAPAPTDLLERCRDYAVPVYPTYGLTETASQVATARPNEAFDHLGTVGRPLLGTDLTVVDEAGRSLDEGETGELVVSGPTVTPGYYGDGDATRAAFGAHGFHTGDVGRIEDGRVYVLNRLDDRVLTGGENVDPGEVASVVRDHPDVADAAVVGLPDEEWGEVVAALVVPEPDAALDADALEAYCRERLAGFKLPRVVEFAESLPRTASGTVEREAVRERLDDARPARVEIPEAEEDDGGRRPGAPDRPSSSSSVPDADGAESDLGADVPDAEEEDP
jgi:O-succinylbenzoic acid--CoA ligase